MTNSIIENPKKKKRLSVVKWIRELKKLKREGLRFPPDLSKLKEFRRYERMLQLFLHANIGPKEIVDVDGECWYRVSSFIEWIYEKQSFKITHEYNYYIPVDYKVRGKVTLIYWIEPTDDIEEKVRNIIKKRDSLIKETFVIQGGSEKIKHLIMSL